MDSTKTPTDRQPCRATRNYPATPEEAERIFLRWPHLNHHRGRPVETVGQTLQRMIDRVPDPLPDEFQRRFAVSIVGNPEFYGRLFAHAMREFQRDGGEA
ncbi:MAG: hypothetical protein HQ582_20855 [Planctomycetes bacterium]|nr:hypothetical protein [Planctomycetota bacterium]